VMCEYVTLVE